VKVSTSDIGRVIPLSHILFMSPNLVQSSTMYDTFFISLDHCQHHENMTTHLDDRKNIVIHESGGKIPGGVFWRASSNNGYAHRCEKLKVHNL